MTLAISSPLPQFFTTAGAPLNNGRIYIGTPFENPETDPVTVYWDAAGTQPAAQPLRTKNGYIVRNGKAAPVFAPEDYSITVRTSTGAMVLYIESSALTNAASQVGLGLVQLRADLANAADPAKGPALVALGIQQAYPLYTAGAKLTERVSVRDFGFSTANGAAANDAAFAAAWAFSKQLDIPAGTYNVSSLPNFAVNRARIRGIGRVVLNFTGIGDGLIVDAGPVAAVIRYDIEIENITISGTAAASDGMYIRGITHSRFRSIRPINFPQAAFRCEFMVSNTFEDCCYSGNEGGGITTLTLHGMVLDKRNAGEQCSNCTFITPIIEGTTGDGIRLIEAIMNTFVGGTSEGNGHGGGAGAVYIGPNSADNVFTSLDMEQNGVAADPTSYHVKNYGVRTKFINPLADSVLTDLFWVAGGNSLSIDGGQIGSMLVDAGTKNTVTRGMAYNGTITDNSAGNLRHLDLYNITSGTTLFDSAGATLSWTPVPVGLAVVGTPTYTGTYQRYGRLVVFAVQITSTTSTANAGGASINLPIPAAIVGTCGAASNNSGLGVGQGTGSITATLCYPPTWGADSSITVTGMYWSA